MAVDAADIKLLVMIIAGVMALAGFAIAALALFRDRARGRRRCPKCWYEMAGVAGLRCPECGRTARSERRLFRTRRRYRWAALGAMLVLLAGAGTVGERVHRKGWAEGTPNVGLIAALPWLDQDSPTFHQLWTRAGTHEYRVWEARWLFRRALRLAGQSTDIDEKMRFVRLFGYLQQQDQLWEIEEQRWGFDREDRVAAVEMVIPLLEDDSTNGDIALLVLREMGEEGWVGLPAVLRRCVRTRTVSYEARFFFDDLASARLKGKSQWAKIPLMPMLHGLSQDPSIELRLELEAEMHACGHNRLCLARSLSASLDDSSLTGVRLEAIAALDVADTEIHARVLSSWKNVHEDLNPSFLRCLVGQPYSAEVEQIIYYALQGKDESRAGALRCVACFAPEACVFQPRIRDMIENWRADYDGTWISDAARAWMACGADPNVPIDAITNALIRTTGEYGLSRHIDVFMCMSSLGTASEESLEKLAEMMERSRSDRCHAAFAYVMLGGDSERGTRAFLNAPEHGGEQYWEEAEIMARAGVLHMPTVERRLKEGSSPPTPPHSLLFAATHAGGDAAALLELLRPLRGSANAETRRKAAGGMDRIERALRGPVWAARVREEERGRVR